MKEKKLAKILFVEDSKNEYLLNLMILRRENVEVDIDYVRDGKEALDYLNHRNKYHYIKTMPDLIILDQRLVTMDGDEVLKLIKKDSRLTDIPLVMFSGMRNKKESEKFLKLGAREFFDKPMNFDKLAQVVNKIENLSFIKENNKNYLCKI